MWVGAMGGTKTALILLLIFIKGATNDANDMMENNVTARSEERKIARVKKMALLGKEVRVVKALRGDREGTRREPGGKEGRIVNTLRGDQDGTRREPGGKGALKENQEGCPPRLAEFLV